jgi:hypothetical protein
MLSKIFDLEIEKIFGLHHEFAQQGAMLLD